MDLMYILFPRGALKDAGIVLGGGEAEWVSDNGCQAGGQGGDSPLKLKYNFKLEMQVPI